MIDLEWFDSQWVSTNKPNAKFLKIIMDLQYDPGYNWFSYVQENKLGKFNMNPPKDFSSKEF